MKWFILILALIAAIALYVFSTEQLRQKPSDQFVGPKELPSVKGPTGLPPQK